MKNWIGVIGSLITVIFLFTPYQQVYGVSVSSASDIQEEPLSDANIKKIRQVNSELQKIISEIEPGETSRPSDLQKIKKDLEQVRLHLTACTDISATGNIIENKNGESQPCMPAKVAWALGKATTK